MSEDIIVSLKFWADQERAHYDAAPPGESAHCLTCLYVEDMERAAVEIERLRSPDERLVHDALLCRWDEWGHEGQDVNITLIATIAVDAIRG